MRLSGMLWKLITARVLAGLYLIVIPAEAGIQTSFNVYAVSNDALHVSAHSTQHA